MNRRRFLAGASVVLPATFAGCLDGGNAADDGGSDDGTPGGSDGNESDHESDGSGDDGGDSGGDEDSVPILTGHEVSEQVATPDAERTSDMDAWGLFVASRDAAEEHYGEVDDEDVQAFVDETEFESGDRLVYLEVYAPQTCYELALAGDPYVAENGLPTVEAAIDRLADDDVACGDAMTPVDLLLRLTFDLEGGSTDVVEARVASYRDDPEELMLEAER